MKKLNQEDQLLLNIKKIHMIGIGGSGMCPIAEILYSKGYQISGSDNNESDPLKRVRKFAKVTLGHKAENVEGAQLVIYSAAINKENVELVRARELNIPIMERSHVLGTLSRLYDNVIGVSGTHGKTTTTGMLTQVLIYGKKDPSAIIGGKLPLINHYGLVGNSDTMVIEACEFADTFLQLSEDVAVLLNIDNDHLDYFKTMDNLIASFHKYVSKAKKVFVNGDDNNSMIAVKDIQGQVITFGCKKQDDYHFDNVTKGKYGYCFDAYYHETFIGNFQLHIPGKHNMYNAMAVIAVACDLGVNSADIANALQDFKGAARRFEYIGDYGFMLADDYGHHPTEIKATLTAAKELNYQRVVVIFQPFTYSRTAMLKKEFAEVLSLADEVVLTEIMGSREINTYNIYSKDLAKLITVPCRIIDDFNDIRDYIISTCKKGDLVITLGCGDIYKVDHLIEDYFKNK